MKKILFFASALAGLLLAGSCQREELAPATEGNVVTFEVSVPEIATKANVVDDGTNINDLVYAVYRTSATSLENAQKDENLQLIYQKNYETNPFKGNQAVVPIELINDQNYLIVFWAQVSDAWVNGNSNNLMRITYPTEMFANNSNLAAFTNATFLSADDIKGGAIKRQIELTRPFAQIRIGTTLPKNVIEDVVLTRSSVTVNGVADAFNALKQQAIVGDQPTTVEFEMAEVPDGNLTVNNVDYKYAAMNYIFANGNVGVAYNIETAQHGTVTTEAIPDVPVQRNYRTNIVGNLLTSEAKYTVTLDQDWGPEGPVDNDYVVTVANNAEDIQEAIESIPEGGSGEIKLGGDIDLGELFAASTQAVTKADNAPLPIVVLKEKSITLDLNGFTITTPWEDETAGKHYYAFDNKGTLKIVDSKATGKIVARGIFNYGHMTLESGTIEACDGNGGYGVRNYEGAEFVMNGGTVATIYEDGDIPGEGYDASPIRVDQGAKAEIKGGIINNVSNFTVAIDNYGETIVDDGTFTSVHTTLANSAVMTINGGSFTCNGLEGVTAHALWAAAGTTTINGGTFNGKDNYNGFNVCASKGAVVNITGGKFLPVHSGSLYGEGTINVTGGEFFDDPSERVDDDYVAVKNETANVYNVVEAYAKVGETKYTSLNAAFTEALKLDEATIVVLHDAEAESVTIPNGKTITLNLNDKTIEGVDNATGSYAVITNKGNLTVVGPGAMKLTATNNRGWNAYSSVISNTVGGNLTVQGEVVIEHLGGTDMAYGIDNLTNGKGTSAITTINKATVKSPYRAIRQFLNGVEATNELYVNAEAVIEGANKSIWMQDPSTNANTGKLVVEEGAELYGDVYLFVTAGSTEWPVSASIPTSTLMNGSKVLTGNLPEGYSVEEKNGVYEVTYKSPAQARLEALINEGGEVVLTENIELSSPIVIENLTVTLDLNGKTITAGKDGYAIENKGELTIKNNGVINGVVYAEGTSAKTTINGGTYNALTNWVFLNSQGASLEINDATINGGSSYPIYSYDANSKLVINDATVNATFGCINAYGTNGTVEINGGTFQMTGVQGKTSHIAYFSNVDAVINGGTFEKVGDINMSGTGGGGICAIYGAKLTIVKGTFAGDYADLYDWGGKNANDRAVAISVEGGTYKFKPTFLAEGFAATQNADGTWTVAKN